MPVETVFNTPPVKEQPTVRRRAAEAGTAGGGEGFSLPEAKDSAAAAQGAEKTAAGDGKPGAAAGQAGADAGAKAKGKAIDPTKPAGEAATSPQPQSAQSDSFIGTLTDLLAAAQGETASTADGVAGEGGKVVDGTPGEKKAGKKSEDAAAVDKTEGDKIAADMVAVATLPDQKSVPPAAVVLSLTLPEATASGGGKPEEAAANKGGAAPAAAGPAVGPQVAGATLAGRAGLAAGADASAGGAASGAVQAAVDAAVPGEHALPAGSLHKPGDSVAAKAAGDAKADAAQAGAPAQGAPAAASDLKPADAVQQALAPIDLSALVQHAVGKGEATRLLSPAEQAVANPALVPGHGQNAAALPATPLHVVPIEIGLRALSGTKQFDIRLDPEELGRVDVNLSISDKGEVSARLVVDRVETLHLLQRDARTLERAFEQAGLKPSDGGVDISLRDPSDQSFRQQRQQEEAPQRSRQPSRSETGDDTVLPTTPVPQRRLVRLGGVDLSI